MVADGEGNVTLGGTVDSWQERELAETVAMGVSGVTRDRADQENAFEGGAVSVVNKLKMK